MKRSGRRLKGKEMYTMRFRGERLSSTLRESLRQEEKTRRRDRQGKSMTSSRKKGQGEGGLKYIYFEGKAVSARKHLSKERKLEFEEFVVVLQVCLCFVINTTASCSLIAYSSLFQLPFTCLMSRLSQADSSCSTKHKTGI